MFHKIIFATINNLALEKDINEVDGIIVDTYLRKFPSQHKTFEMHNGIEFIEAIKKFGPCEMHRMSFIKNFIT